MNRLRKFAKKCAPTAERLSKTTGVWSLAFLVSLLSLNAFAGAGANDVFYSHYRDLSRFSASLVDHVGGKGGIFYLEYAKNTGGTVPAEDAGLAASGLSPFPSSDSDAGAFALDRASGSALPVAGAFGGAAEERTLSYRAAKGDTVESVARKFGISPATVSRANGGVKTLKKGMTLVILPVSGVLHAVREGDTLHSVAAQYRSDPAAVKRQNPDWQNIFMSGTGRVIVPDADQTSYAATVGKLPELKNFFALPAAGYDAGELHPENAVDIANKCGTAVKAAADGVVAESASSGWNEGYGTYVLVDHGNGAKTRYAHLQKTSVKIGAVVKSGEKIGIMGNSGNAAGPTGCHLHFEVLGAKNPFATK